MKTRNYIAALAAFLGFGLSCAAASPHAFKTVDILNSTGARLRCNLGQDGRQLFVVGPTGIEVFEHNSAGAVPDISTQPAQFFRTGDVIWIAHPGGVATFTKTKKTNQSPDRAT